MASLLTQSQINTVTGIFQQHFDTFATNNITIFKEPKKIITTSPGNNLPGYDNSSIIQNVTYQQVSGVYPVLLVKDDNAEQKMMSQTRNMLGAGKIKVKVKKDCRNFILDGKNEILQIADVKYNVISEDSYQNYFGLEYYYFILEKTT